jgi:hypothetical protein
MPYTNAEGAAPIIVRPNVAENDPVKIQLLGRIPMLYVPGKELQVPRVPSLVPRKAIIVGGCGSVPDQSDTVETAIYGFNDFQTSYVVCDADQDRFGAFNNPDRNEENFAHMKGWYAWFEHIDQQTGDPKFGGLPDIAAPDKFLNIGGAPLSLPCLQKAYSLVTANNGRATVIMSHSRTLDSYENLCRANGFDTPTLPWVWYDPARGWTQGEVPAFRGTPWLANDMIFDGNDPLQRRIYFMVLGDDGGRGHTRGVSAIVPSDRRGQLFRKRVTAGHADFEAQTLQAAKVAWVSLTIGSSIGSQGALSILTNFGQIDPCEAAPA